ncbi:MAG: hypothetical protein NXI09_14105 [Bacteroidetes bacterium]|nr:hypothetical protein [Bacteroidota bacterium]
MSKPKTILWFPLVRYLSLKPYQSLIESWDRNDRHILIDSSAYSGKFKSLEPQERDDLLEIYDEVYILSPLKESYSRQGNVNEFLKYRELKQRLRTLNEKENFTLGIFPTDFSYEFRVLRQICPSIKLLVLQVSFKRIERLKSYGLSHRIKATLYDRILGVPLFRTKYHFGNQDPKAWYLFWTEKWTRSILKPEGVKTIVSNATIVSKPDPPVLPVDSKLTALIDDRPLVSIFLNKRLSIGEDAFKDYSEFYTNLINSCPQYFFVIKVHPYEDFEYCKKLYEGRHQNNSLMVFSEYTPQELLVNSQLFITQWSTAILDAMMYRIPTLLVNPDDTHSMRKWFVDDFPFLINKKDELPVAVTNTLRDLDEYWFRTDSFIQNSFGPSFKEGSKRTLLEIYKVIDEN